MPLVPMTSLRSFKKSSHSLSVSVCLGMSRVWRILFISIQGSESLLRTTEVPGEVRLHGVGPTTMRYLCHADTGCKLGSSSSRAAIFRLVGSFWRLRGQRLMSKY